jgi:two-component system phosphate regulon sensor histidine kinase PhoR
MALAYMALILVVLASTGLLLVGYSARAFMDSLHTDLTVRAALVRDAAQSGWPFESLEAGDDFAARLASAAEARITLIRSDGVVTGESEQPAATLANHGNRPEFIAAMAGGVGIDERRSATRDERFLYVAVPLTRPSTGGGAVIEGAVRVALSVEFVHKRIAGLRTGLAAALATGLLMAALLGLWAGERMLTSPLGKVVHGARQFVRGRLDQRIELQTGDEWEELSEALNDMAGSIQRQIADLREERNRIQGILEGLPDAVMLIGNDGALLLANRKAREWLGLPAASGNYRVSDRDSLQTPELLGRTPELRDFIAAALADPIQSSAEIKVGHPRVLHLDVAARWLGAPKQSELLVGMHDIGELRRLEQARRDLVANVSHELKTPIGAIRVLAESLTRSGEQGEAPDPALVTDFLGRIVSETGRLAGLVEEMLYLSRLESKPPTHSIAEIDLASLARQAVRALEPVARSRSVELVFDEKDDTRLRCDPDHIERAMRALIDNAVKFSPPGGVIRAEVASLGNTVEFAVTDQGPGIPSETLPRVFERFFKGEESRHTPGSGLGLAIVKHIVQSHGGKVQARSELGRGSTFSFVLPKRLP